MTQQCSAVIFNDSKPCVSSNPFSIKLSETAQSSNLEDRLAAVKIKGYLSHRPWHFPHFSEDKRVKKLHRKVFPSVSQIFFFLNTKDHEKKAKTFRESKLRTQNLSQLPLPASNLQLWFFFNDIKPRTYCSAPMANRYFIFWFDFCRLLYSSL